MSNLIGKRGESIFETIITRHIPGKGPLFYPTFLGDKYPTVDFLVDLQGYPFKAYFFASIKTTTLGYYAGGKKIKGAIGKKEVARLNQHVVPVYLFGIDAIQEKGYFISANNLDKSMNINGIPTKYPVDSAHIELLWKEVAGYWENSRKKPKFVSSFK